LVTVVAVWRLTNGGFESHRARGGQMTDIAVVETISYPMLVVCFLLGYYVLGPLVEWYIER
jgi:hypothetical protein